MNFHKGLLAIQPEEAIASIVSAIKEHVGTSLRKRGAVVAVSGGIDSSVSAALCTRALGKDHVLALMLPEKTSSPNSLVLGKLLVEHLGIQSLVQDITAIIDVMRENTISEFEMEPEGFQSKPKRDQTGGAQI